MTTARGQVRILTASSDCAPAKSSGSILKFLSVAKTAQATNADNAKTLECRCLTRMLCEPNIVRRKFGTAVRAVSKVNLNPNKSPEAELNLTVANTLRQYKGGRVGAASGVLVVVATGRAWSENQKVVYPWRTNKAR